MQITKNAPELCGLENKFAETNMGAYYILRIILLGLKNQWPIFALSVCQKRPCETWRRTVERQC